MSFPKYEEYKDSGVEWLGEVPTHWEVISIKHIVVTPVTDGPHETPEFIDDGVPFVSAEAVSSGEIDFSKIRGFISQVDHERYCQKYKPKYGDIYMVKSGASTGTTAIVETSQEFSIWSPLAAIRCDQNSLPKFVLSFLRSSNFQEGVTLNWSFGTQQNIGMNVIENLQITRPPMDEQIAIASFLDVETSKIDASVAQQRRLIELLKEKRQAVISHAVTKGLDPSVPMKPSGIEWLGDVPEHWNFGPLKRFWDVIDCKHVTVPFFEEGYPVASVMEVRAFELDLSQVLRTNEENYRLLIGGGRKPQRGDVIYCRNTANTGTSAYVGTDEPIAIGQDVVLIKSRRQNGRYLNYILHGETMVGQLTQCMVGSTFKRINVAHIRELIVTCPPKYEQDRIVVCSASISSVL